jgi:hypothetical protein
MLERASVGLLWLAAGLFLVFGLAAFVAPGWAGGEFPWNVGPFLAQTIGGWSLGTAAMAAYAARVRRPERIYPVLVYCWLFGIGQLVVVVAFADRLETGRILTYPYLAGLLALVGSALAGVGHWLTHRRQLAGGAGRVPWWGRLLTAVVAGFVLLLAVGTLVAGPDGATARGEIFPEQMGLFSIRAFSAFFFALAAAQGSTLLSNHIQPYRDLGWAGMFLIVPITLAALLNLSMFDFSGKPGGLLYLLAYVVVGVIIAVVLFYDRRKPEAFARRPEHPQPLT